MFQQFSRMLFFSQGHLKLKLCIFQDLVALLNNVDNEIKLCETKLLDEQEKIRKYKVNKLKTQSGELILLLNPNF